MNVARSTVAAVALVAAHFIWVATHHETAVIGPDVGGYFAQAKMLATEGQTYREPASPLAFVGPHWLDRGDGRYFSKYPPGFPLLLSVPYALFGASSSLWVDPLLTSGALLGLFFLARLWTGPGWALAAAALMATSPLVNEHAVPGFAHAAVAVLLVWGLYALARWSGSLSWRWLAVAGLCAGAIPTARYAEALYVGAPALYVLLHLRRSGRSWKGVGAAAWPGALAAALPMAALALRNQLAFGAFWRTAYTISGEQTGFGLQYFAANWASYLDGLSGGLGVLFGVGLAGLAVLTTSSRERDRGLLLAALVVPSTLLYMSYYWGGGAMSQRFLLPTYYLYALASVWFLKILTGRLGRPALAAAALLLALALPWGLSRSADQLVRRAAMGRTLVALTDSLGRHLPDGAILLADRSLGQHLDIVSPWRIGHAEALLDVQRPERLHDGVSGKGAPQSRRRPAQASDTGPRPDSGRPNPRAGGSMERLARYRDLSDAERGAALASDLRSWTGPGGRAFVLVPGGQVEELPAGTGIGWRIRARIELPEMQLSGEVADRGARGRRRPPGPGLREGNLRPGVLPGGAFPPVEGVRRGMGPRDGGRPGAAMGRPVSGAPSEPVLLVELLL